ncbi:MAG: Holo-[acyl-carrier-protein] synthase [Pelotomaculum thermopropionicum]|uniref:Holo-[acyl-carrier-protein] synthase n=1 Tax=Pelotomaculum thermopropionicum TaxID=110500 RepID=A0A101HSI5_9FIRM|nr:MAG: Holo-[acyl-carrier-protein] synthase [Pelotomaculum thermopropionicum]
MKFTSGLAGVGTDIIEIDRVERAVQRGGRRFLERVFTPAECFFCDARKDRFACYAARFAAKEAVLKALGSGLAGCRWVDVEISREEGGPPKVKLSGTAAEIIKKNGIAEVLVSLSHNRKYAVAFAVALREEA